MTPDMPPEQLAEIKARADRATPGPWHKVSDCPHPSELCSGCSETWTGVREAYAPGDSEREYENADFIAHARSDIPALIAALEEAQADVQSLLGDCPELEQKSRIEQLEAALREIENCGGAKKHNDSYEEGFIDGQNELSDIAREALDHVRFEVQAALDRIEGE